MAQGSNASHDKAKGAPDLEPFRTALRVTTRAIAADKEMEVVFASDKPALAGNRARLPEFSKKITANEIAVTRGLGDSMALRRACHDSRVHSTLAPEGKQARAIYDAVEQARCEAVGAIAMTGVADNLAMMLDDKYIKAKFPEISSKEDAPLEEAVALAVREKLTGRKPPRSASNVVNLWKDFIDERASAALADLAGKVGDQDAFARVIRSMLASMEMADDISDDDQSNDEDSASDEEQPRSGEENQKDDDGEAGSEEAPSDENESSDESQETEAQDGAETSDEMSEDDADAETPGETRRAELPFTNLPPEFDYKVFTREFDEEVSAAELCDEAELDRLRAFLDKQLNNLSGVVGRLANRLQRRLLAKQNRSWEFDIEEGYLDAARLVRIVIDPMQPLSFKREKDTNFRDTVVSLVIDNSGSMRGRPITVAATCADILARTLERCGVKVEVLGFTTKAWKGRRGRNGCMAASRRRRGG
jgi:cobaltochelatase CobT